MNIVYKSKNDLLNINKELELITNSAIILTNKIDYNNKLKTMEIPILRKAIISSRLKLFGLGNKIIFDNKNKIKSKITIRNIINCKIIDDCGKVDNKATILFGINIKEKEIYISSVEEDQGNQLLEIRLKVEDYNIEINDI